MKLIGPNRDPGQQMFTINKSKIFNLFLFIYYLSVQANAISLTYQQAGILDPLQAQTPLQSRNW